MHERAKEISESEVGTNEQKKNNNNTQPTNCNSTCVEFDA